MASIKDIAKQAGVSVSTVSRVINESGYVSEKAKKSVLDAIKQLNYQPSSIARSMVTKQSNTLGLLIPHIDSPFFAGLAVGVEEAARELGYNVLLAHTKEDADIEKASLKTLTERRVDGIIVTPVGKSFGHFKKALQSTPCVLAGRTTDKLSVSSVEVNNYGGSRTVMNHLLEQGHRKIGVINGPLFLSTGIKRWEGVQHALTEHSVTLPASYIKEADFTIRSGFHKAQELLRNEEKPSAIFAANHMTALGVMKALRDSNLRIPEDVALASFDGFEDSDIDFVIDPKITANIHPTAELAQNAVQILHNRMTNKNATRMSANVVNLTVQMTFQARASTLGHKSMLEGGG
ncbi:LacI family DNA-binding transcriptional regulator [Shouchella shacheensis]|uniref:LacI family DNA-binding transcriptional regulator n=1 Tax=Shouchella shacheensis TaxID=1649580 RepID=UPI0007401BD3|nr:LacI family DNA-binding transcriptional regulator [Shouchella shacheensis]